MEFFIFIVILIYFILVFIIGYPLSFIINLFKGRILTPKEWWNNFERYFSHFNE